MKYLFSLLILVLPLLSDAAEPAALRVSVKNTTYHSRAAQSVVVEWSTIEKRLPRVAVGQVLVRDAHGREIPSQVLFRGGSKPVGLLFQADLAPRSVAHYRIEAARPAPYDTLTFGRLVPERKDDFAWENNRVAYRMYGPALEATGEVSSGIDLWLKRTDRLAIDRWYSKGYDYHTDHGEGLDCYKVGPSLGCGAAALVSGGRLRMARNFVRAQVLDCGVLRTSFRLHYAPVEANDVMIRPTIEVSIDANNPLNTITVCYDGLFDTVRIACGIVLRDAKPEELVELPSAISYAQPMDGDNGMAYLAVVTSDAQGGGVIDSHIVKYRTLRPGERYTYRSGGYWSGRGVTPQQWSEILRREADCFARPLVVRVH